MLFFVLALVFSILFVFLYTRKPVIYRPSHIIIIRHGEKDEGSNFLNAKGVERATSLVNWVNQTIPQQITEGNPIVATYSPEPGPFAEDSRPRQTISLAAFHIGLPIYGSYRYFDTEAAASEILGNPYHDNKPVIVCWEHTCIQNLVRALTERLMGKTEQLNVPFWQSIDFASVIVIKPDGSISLTCENVLTGDDAECATYKDYRAQRCTVY